MKTEPPILDEYARYTLEALILEDRVIGDWFVDVCVGIQPSSDVSEETLALMQGHGLIWKTEFGWVLGSEGRNFARNLELIPEPSNIEINPLPAIEKRRHFRRFRSKNIEQIWRDFFASHSEACRNILLEHYLPIVKYITDRICAKLPGKMELADLVSSGIFGLKDAIEAFDPNRGVKFETYCTKRIRGSILDELRNMDWVPRLVRARAHRLERVIQSLEAQLGRIPTEQEIAEKLSIDMEEFHRLQRDACTIGLGSLNNKSNENEDEKDLREIDIIEDQRSQISAIEAKKCDLKNLLTQGVTLAEKLIIVLYYYEEMTIKEISEQLDLPESRVSQMHSSLIARLKAQMSSRHEQCKPCS